MKKIKKHLYSTLASDFFIPVLFLIGYLIFVYLAKGSVPTAEELIETFASLYAKYGYEIIFVAAFLESLLIINLFVPGQLAMALGIIFAKTGHTDLTTVVLTACCGVILGYVVDYCLGYFGFSGFIKKLGYSQLLIKSRSTLGRYKQKALVLSYVNSNFGAFAALTAGASEMPFIRFFTLTALATLFWSSIWGIVVYTFGDVILDIFKKYSFLTFIVFIGSIWFLSRFKKS